MANEVLVQASLRIISGHIRYQSQPANFNDTLLSTKGPSPGAVTVSTEGTDIDFTELLVPGWCRLMNLDDTNFVTWGIWDPEGGKFYPCGELGPGESYVIKMSRDLQQEFGTGTGTTGAETNRFRIKADSAPCDVLVEAFEAEL